MPEDVFNNKAFSLYPIISHVVQSTVVPINIESSQLFFEKSRICAFLLILICTFGSLLLKLLATVKKKNLLVFEKY